MSREGITDNVVDIPASRNVNAKFPVDAARSVAGMRQKINIIDDRLIVAWAGNFLRARALIRAIASAVEKGASSLEEMEKVVANAPEIERNDVSLIGTILTPNEKKGLDLSHFSYCANKKTSGDVEVCAAGTGVNLLFKLIPQFIDVNPTPEFESNGDESYQWIYNLGDSLVARLVGHETLTGQNILDWWVGAIEMATIVEGKLQKIANTLHTIWSARKIDKSRYDVRLLPKFIKYDYFDDCFVAQILDQKEHSLRAYTPILKNRHDYDFSQLFNLDMDHNKLYCYMIIECNDSKKYFIVHIRRYNDSDSRFKVEKIDTRLRIHLPADLQNSIEKFISNETVFPSYVCQITT